MVSPLTSKSMPALHFQTLYTLYYCRYNLGGNLKLAFFFFFIWDDGFILSKWYGSWAKLPWAWTGKIKDPWHRHKNHILSNLQCINRNWALVYGPPNPNQVARILTLPSCNSVTSSSCLWSVPPIWCHFQSDYKKSILEQILNMCTTLHNTNNHFKV